MRFDILTQMSIFLLVIPSSIAQSTNDPSSSYESDSAFQSAILNSTNFYRTAHNATSLTWNDTLASYAQSYSKNCQFAHSGGPYGENLAAGYANATASIEAWGNEGSQYDFSAAQFSETTGHFTQLVWKGTRSTGCGRMNCSGENNTPGWYVVCEYYPPGNLIGNFSQNVQAAVSKGSSSSGPSGAVGFASVSWAFKFGLPLLWILMGTADWW